MYESRAENGSVTDPLILYIAGYGRSGSTLLDLLMGNHPRVFGAGEVSRLFWDIADRRPCSCGSEYRDCEVWGRVLERVFPGLSDRDFEDLRDRHLRAQVRLKSDLMGEYRALWQAIFRTLSAVTGSEVIVDSSKSARRTRRRSALLRDVCHFDTRTVHLVRDPRAVMWSASRGSNTRIQQGLPPRRYEELRALVHWTYTNWVVCGRKKGARHGLITVRYEDLVRFPVAELTRVCRLIDIDADPLLDRLDTGRDFDPGHGVGGNRFRKKGPVVLRPDSEWERKLPFHHRASALVAWPVARRFGYRPWPPPPPSLTPSR